MTKKHDANQKLGVIKDAPDVKADYYSQAENIVQYTSNHVGNVLSIYMSVLFMKKLLQQSFGKDRF